MMQYNDGGVWTDEADTIAESFDDSITNAVGTCEARIDNSDGTKFAIYTAGREIRMKDEDDAIVFLGEVIERAKDETDAKILIVKGRTLAGRLFDRIVDTEFRIVGNGKTLAPCTHSSLSVIDHVDIDDAYVPADIQADPNLAIGKALVCTSAYTGQALLADLNATDTTITLASVVDIFVNKMIRIDEEYMLVTGRDLALNTITVTRGYNSTYPAPHDNAACLYYKEVDYISKSSLQVGINDAVGEIEINVGHSGFYVVGDIVKLEDEEMYVTGKLAGPERLQVTRAYNSTTAVAHLATVTIYRRIPNRVGKVYKIYNASKIAGHVEFDLKEVSEDGTEAVANVGYLGDSFSDSNDLVDITEFSHVAVKTMIDDYTTGLTYTAATDTSENTSAKSIHVPVKRQVAPDVRNLSVYDAVALLASGDNFNFWVDSSGVFYYRTKAIAHSGICIDEEADAVRFARKGNSSKGRCNQAIVLGGKTYDGKQTASIVEDRKSQLSSLKQGIVADASLATDEDCARRGSGIVDELGNEVETLTIGVLGYAKSPEVGAIVDVKLVNFTAARRYIVMGKQARLDEGLTALTLASYSQELADAIACMARKIDRLTKAVPTEDIVVKNRTFKFVEKLHLFISRVEVIYNGSTEYLSTEKNRCVTNAGVELFLDRLLGKTASLITHIGLGTGTTEAKVTDTALSSEVATLSGNRETITFAWLDDYTMRVTWTCAALDAVFAAPFELNEIGLFTAAGAGTMFCRVVPDPVNFDDIRNAAEIKIDVKLEQMPEE